MTNILRAGTPVKPGDILLFRIKGPVGWAVWAGQALNRDLSRWTHAAVVLKGGELFESQPGGARIVPLSTYWGRPFALVAYRQPPGGVAGRVPLMITSRQRDQIDDSARVMVNVVKYGWLTYLWLALTRFGVRSAWLERKVSRPSRMICSQTADWFYSMVGVELFTDGRQYADVTPGDLARLARRAR